MPIDASIISGLKPTEVNPLDTATKAIGLKQSLLQNQVLGQMYGSKVATGRALAASLDPATGLPDQAKVGQYFEAHPEDRPYSGDALTTAQTLNSGQLANAGQELTNQRTALGLNADQGKVLSGGMISFLQQFPPTDASGKPNPPPTAKDFADHIGLVLTQMGPNATPDVQARAKAAIARAEADPSSIPALAAKLAAVGNPTSETINLLMGQLAHGGLTASEASTPTPVLTKGPNNTLVPSVERREQFVQQTNGGPIQAGGALTAQGVPLAEAGLPAYNVQDQATGQPGIVTRGAAAEAAAGAGAPATLSTGPQPGVVEAGVGQAKDSQLQFAADVNDAGGFSQRMVGLNNAESALAKAQTGKGGQVVQDWRALVNTIAPGALNDADKTEIKSFDEARKYLTDYANRRGQAMGIGTDAGREMVHAANPSVDINKAAAQDIIKVLRGMERMQNAQVAAAQSAGIGPGQYSTWRAGWNRSVDPTGFMADQIPAAERAKQYDAMKPPQQVRYAKAVKAAVDAGYFTLNDLRK